MRSSEGIWRRRLGPIHLFVLFQCLDLRINGDGISGLYKTDIVTVKFKVKVKVRAVFPVICTMTSLRLPRRRPMTSWTRRAIQPITTRLLIVTVSGVYMTLCLAIGLHLQSRWLLLWDAWIFFISSIHHIGRVSRQVFGRFSWNLRRRITGNSWRGGPQIGEGAIGMRLQTLYLANHFMLIIVYTTFYLQ